MIVRNPEAACGNCPFWLKMDTKEGERPRGECRARIPDLIAMPKRFGPTIDNPTGGGMAIVPERLTFTPPPEYWCASHPMILAEVQDNPMHTKGADGSQEPVAIKGPGTTQ